MSSLCAGFIGVMATILGLELLFVAIWCQEDMRDFSRFRKSSEPEPYDWAKDPKGI